MLNQEELISAWVQNEVNDTNEKEGYTVISILNKSINPIYDVIVSIAKSGIDVNPSFLSKSHKDLDFASMISIIPSGKYLTKVSNGYHGMGFVPAVEIAFRDNIGKYWIKKNNGNLVQVASSPSKFYNIEEPIIWKLPGPDYSNSK